MSRPDDYWAHVGKAAEAERNAQAGQSAAIHMRWAAQSSLMAAVSKRKYAGRVRPDGKVLCLKCRKYRQARFFWVIAGGSYLNKCKTCSGRIS